MKRGSDLIYLIFLNILSVPSEGVLVCELGDAKGEVLLPRHCATLPTLQQYEDVLQL